MTAVLAAAVFLMPGGAAAAGFRREQYELVPRREIQAYLPESFEPGRLYPLVIALCCTSGTPWAEIITNGWDRIAAEEEVIVVSPEYRDNTSYPECPYIRSVIDDACERYPADPGRIYASGFSNGGATAIALADTYPGLLSGIAAMGWMTGMREKDPDALIPFLVIQGTEDAAEKTPSGAMRVSSFEREALADLFACNGMKEADAVPDYDAYPYWGYRPDETDSVYPAYHDYHPYGYSPVFQSDTEWKISRFYKDGFENPFAELILVEGAGHTPHDRNAGMAWNFFSRFRRDGGGILRETAGEAE